MSERKFDYNNVGTVYNQMKNINDNIKTLLTDTDNEVHNKVDVCEEAIYGDLGNQLLLSWDNISSNFPNFVDNFENWSALVAKASGDYSQFEADVAGFKNANPLGVTSKGATQGAVATSSYNNSLTAKDIEDLDVTTFFYEKTGATYIDTGMVSYAKTHKTMNIVGDALNVVSIVLCGVQLGTAFKAAGAVAQGGGAIASGADDAGQLLLTSGDDAGRLALTSGDDAGQLLLTSGDDAGRLALPSGGGTPGGVHQVSQGVTVADDIRLLPQATGATVADDGVRMGIQYGDDVGMSYQQALHNVRNTGATGAEKVDSIWKLADRYGTGTGGTQITAKSGSFNHMEQLAANLKKKMIAGTATPQDKDLYLATIYRISGEISESQYDDIVANLASSYADDLAASATNIGIAA